MARAVRLKVYSTPAGFDDAYVAARSQAAALKAWGVRGDLFGLGEAKVVTDPELTAEPLAHPGQVIRRPRGDMAAMLASAPRPTQQAKSHTRKPSQTAESPRSPPAAPLPPDRSALDAAEASLTAGREQLAADLKAIGIKQAELDGRERKMREAGETQVRELERARAAAQRAYLKAGGEPA